MRNSVIEQLFWVIGYERISACDGVGKRSRKSCLFWVNFMFKAHMANAGFDGNYFGNYVCKLLPGKIVSFKLSAMMVGYPCNQSRFCNNVN